MAIFPCRLILDSGSTTEQLATAFLISQQGEITATDGRPNGTPHSLARSERRSNSQAQTRVARLKISMASTQYRGIFSSSHCPIAAPSSPSVLVIGDAMSHQLQCQPTRAEHKMKGGECIGCQS